MRVQLTERRTNECSRWGISQVESVLADGSTRLLIEAQMGSGQQCSSGTIVEPFGQETVRAQAIGQDGKTFGEDTVTITTAPR